MRFIFAFFVTFFSLATLADHLPGDVPEYPKQGRYVGFIHMDGQPQKIPTTIDFVKSETTDGKHALIAYLKLSAGGFQSLEYVTQKYTVADYLWQDRRLVLDGNVPENGPDTTLYDGLVSEDNSTITGKIRTLRGGSIEGTVELHLQTPELTFEKLNQAIYPNLPIQSTITGEYTKWCDHLRPIEKVQIEAIKTQGWESPTGVPLAGYVIQGRFIKRGKYYPEENMGTFTSLPYDVYRAKTTLPYSNKTCQFLAEGMRCEGDPCLYRRDLGAIDTLFVKKELETSNPPFDAHALIETRELSPMRDETVQGQYEGYLYYNGRKLSSPLSFSVALSGEPQRNENGGLSRKQISVNARLHTALRDGNLNDFVALRMLPTEVPTREVKQLVVDSAGDFLFLIEHWSSKGVMGEVYSKTFGKVGPFVALKEATFKLPTKSLMPCARGKMDYRSNGRTQTRTYEMMVEKSIGNLAELPAFFPFKITGMVRDTTLTPTFATQSFLIQEGHFDPYVGALFIRTAQNRFTYGVMNVETYEAYLSPVDERGEKAWSHASNIIQFKRSEF